MSTGNNAYIPLIDYTKPDNEIAEELFCALSTVGYAVFTGFAITRGGVRGRVRGGPNLKGAFLLVGETGTVYTSLTSYCYMPFDWFVFMHLGKTTLVVMFLYLLSKSF